MAIESQFHSENFGFPMYGSLGWMAESECGSGFRLNHPPQIQLDMQNQRHWSQSQSSGTNFFLPSSKNNQITALNPNRNLSMDISFSVAAAQVEKQSQEIDRHIRLQNERLKQAVQEEMKQRLAVMVNKMESEMRVLLSQKQEEMDQALRRRMDLEEVLRKLEAENLIRQREARENEAMVLALKNTLLQKKDRASNPIIDGSNDAESCCDSNREENERRERVNREEEREMGRLACRGCHYRTSRVVLLPCRHLCLCKHCETGVEVCPVCHTPKKGVEGDDGIGLKRRGQKRRRRREQSIGRCRMSVDLHDVLAL